MMRRKIVSIDEKKCNGCGLCIEGCHEGAIELIDGKAKLVSDEYCDGLGDCLPQCPTGAIEIIERESKEYDEEAVKKRMADKANEKSSSKPMPCGCPGTMAKKIERKTLNVANNNVVKKVSGADVGIPEGGFAINISGNSDALIRFASACSEGKQASWDYQVEGFEDNDIMTAVGAGPMVLCDSQKITSLENYKNEGFTESKILTNGGARSAIGVKADGNVVIVTTSAKVSELGGIMLSLGCVDAMNLDGGASSGLYSNGRFLTTPGRNLSNVLYFK